MTIKEEQFQFNHMNDMRFNPNWTHVFWSFFSKSLFALVIYGALSSFFQVVLAATPADTMIRNRASVTYKAAVFEPSQRQESNEVEVRVSAVEALSLTQSQTINAAPNAPFSLAHTLVNTGNVASSYQFNLIQQAGFIASNLKLILDSNNNGRADVGEATLPSNGTTTATIIANLPAGASVSLLIVGSAPSTALATDTTQIKLIATTVLQTVSANNTDIVQLVAGPAFSLSKSSNKPNKELLPGEEVSYDIQANNIGASSALALAKANNVNPILLNNLSTDAAGLFNIRIDGVLASKVLFRDHIPVGTTYSGGLNTPNTNPGKVLLYRMAGDAPFSYQTTAGVNVIEVATAFDSVSVNSSIRMGFKVKLLSNYEGEIKNTAELFYGDGSSTVLSQSAHPTNQVRNTTPIGPSPDLIVRKTHNTDFIVDQNSQFQIIVENVSQLATTEAIVVTDLLPTEMQFVSATGVGWSCSVAGQLVTCTLAKGLPASTIYSSSKSSPINLVVKVPASVLVGTSGNKRLTNTAIVQGGGESVSKTKNNSSTDDVLVIQQIASSTIKGHVWLDLNHDRLFQGNETTLKGWYVELLKYENVSPSLVNAIKKTAASSNNKNIFINANSLKPIGTTFVLGSKVYTLIARSAETDTSGAYAINNIVAGNNYAIRFYSPQGIWYGTPVDGELGVAVSNAVADHDLGMLKELVFTGGQIFDKQGLPVDYTGLVYDSLKRFPIAGAKLKLSGPKGFDPANHLIGGNDNLNQLKDTTGVYQYLLTSKAPTGIYSIQVTPPNSYSWPSVIIPPAANALAAQAGAPERYVVQNQSTAPKGAESTLYYLNFVHDATSRNLSNNHIPLDPPFESGPWVVEKKANKTSVEVVDFVDYTVTVSNKTKLERSSLTIFDQAATGFSYVEKSAYITLPGQKKLAIQPTTVSNGKGGFYLQFNIALPLSGSSVDKIKIDEIITLTYRMAVSPNAILGDGKNTAWAQSVGANPATSNKANAIVKINQGVFSTQGFILGTVFLDCNKSGVQEATEPGIAGVRLYLEDGTYVITDSLGKYSLYGVSPTTHVLKLDETTLPANSFFGSTGNRASGLSLTGQKTELKSATTQFIDLKNGQLFQANFAEQSCTDNIKKIVEQRNTQSQKNIKQEIVSVVNGSDRFTAESQVQNNVDVKSKPSAGLVGTQAANIQLKNAAIEFANLSKNSQLPDNSESLGSDKTPSLEEKVKLAKDNSFEILNLKNQQVLEFAYTNIQVKGPIGTVFKVFINEVEVPDSRVGKKSTLADKKVEAWEYVAVGLKKGINNIKVLQNDPMGNTRGNQSLQVVAPGDLAKIYLDVPKDALADGQTAAIIKLRLVDSQGTPVSSRTPITLNTKIGDWLINDLSTQEPGVQIFVQGGK